MMSETGLDSLPPEIFMKLLTYLSTKELVRCRAVNQRWKSFIDDVTRSDNFWKRKCQSDFPNVIGGARHKCRRDMEWYDLYRSLSLWSKLGDATEEHDEFCAANIVRNEIRSFTILRSDLIGVHKRNAIKYYNLETFEKSEVANIPGDYVRYVENDMMLVVLNPQIQLYIIQKVVNHQRNNNRAVCHGVKTFLVDEEYVYYVDLNDDIYMVMCKDKELRSHLLGHLDEGIIALGICSGKLNILTFQRRIYTAMNSALVCVATIGPTSNILHQLHKYNLLEMMDWRIYIQWMYIMLHVIPQGPLQDIVTMLTYGDVIFVGTNYGVLRVYYRPYILGEFDLLNVEPIRQYNFMERYDCPVLATCPILSIDVIEVSNGHKVVIAMPKKIAILNYKHDFAYNSNYINALATLPDVDLRVVESTH